MPTPTVIEEPSLEALVDRDIAKFQELDPTYAYFLPSDPVVKVVRHGSWRDFILRHYINDVARSSRLIAFATGGMLDHLAANEGITRMLVDEGNTETNPPIPETYESDERLRQRIIDIKAGRNGAGSVPYYRYHAMTADPRVKDVNVFSPDFPDGYNMGGRVSVCVLSYESNGVPSVDLLERVNFALKQPQVKVVSDLIQVEAARPVFVVIKAKIVLNQTTPIDVYQALSEKFTAAFAEQVKLGQDITIAWIIKNLSIDGVHDVVIQEPTASIKIDPSQFPYLQSLVLTFGGFDKISDYNLSDAERFSIYDRIYRYYYDSCVRYQRSATQIAIDLPKIAVEGVIQPTTEGFARWLGLDNVIVNATTGILLPEDEIAYLIFESMQPAYDAARTTNSIN
ncbi:MAG: baseplate J/gp47 family protein [Chitinophagaceae bacterium]